MLRLLTFGGLVLEADDGTPVTNLRRSWLATLAVIAAGGERGVPRERLVALFWPDANEERARHSARQVLYGLRQQLGREVVRSAGSALSLDPLTITSDLGEFRAALAAGNRQTAVGLVRGPFLDSFYLPGVAAFERWVEDERSRLAASTTSALVTLAADATRADDADAAVEWWRQLTSLDPLNGRYAVGFLKALAGRGNRAEALAFARQHELVMRRELEADPDPEVQRIVAELRLMSSPPVLSSNGSAATAPVLPHTSGTPPAVATDPPNEVADLTRQAPRWSLAAVAAGALLLLAVTAAFARQRGWFRPPSTMPTLAVGMIREEGAPDSQRSGRVITDMIATSLARVEGLHVLANSRLLELMTPGTDSAAGYAGAARRAGATDLLEGELVVAPTGAQSLELRHVELRTGIVRDVYRATAANRYALVDSVTRMVGNRYFLALPRGSIADATTRSQVAYRFYEEGLRAYLQGDASTSKRFMHAALAEDSMFAMAAWYEALLAGPPGSTPDGRPVTEARRRALRLAERAPERERLTIMASILGENQEPAALVVAESLNTRYPDDPRAMVTLAITRSSFGDFEGAREVMERAIALDSVTETRDSRDCRMCQDLYHLSNVYFWWDSLPAVQRVARRLLARHPEDVSAYLMLAVSSARLGDSAAAYAAHNKLSALGAVETTARFLIDITLEAYDLVDRDIRPFLGSASAIEWGNAAWSYLITLRNQGRLRDAAEFTRNGWIPGLPPLNVKPVLHPFHLPLLLLETGNARDAARGFASAPLPTADWAPGVLNRHLAWRGTLTGMALAAAGDTVAVRAMADSVERWGRGSGYGRDRLAHHYLRGMVHVAGGRHDDAVGAFRSAMFSPSLGFTRVNLELGRSLLVLNRPREAIAAIQPALRGALDASNFYVTRTELHELLADAFARANQADSAAKHFRAVVRAWERADPVFQERRAKAAAWLARHATDRVAAR